MRFWKYEGLGNDFIVARLDPDRVDPAAVVAICDRHFGVGADGVLAVSSSPGSAGRMTVFNADGSRPEMCGNGVRCVARFLRADAPGPTITIDTDAGPMAASFVDDLVEVQLARPRVLGVRQVPLEGVLHKGFDLTAGNPHLVLLDPPPVDPASLGARLQASSPNGVNVSFAKVVDRTSIELVVYERGCGLTLACGTAACATVVAAESAGVVTPGVEIAVKLPGGVLAIRSLDESRLQMTGPAREVFVGEWAGALAEAASAR